MEADDGDVVLHVESSRFGEIDGFQGVSVGKSFESLTTNIISREPENQMTDTSDQSLPLPVKLLLRPIAI
jgi:hypothetical protein